jgi:hypothetical protein
MRLLNPTWVECDAADRKSSARRGRAGAPRKFILDHPRGTLWTTCQDNGLLMLKFTNGAWPSPKTPHLRVNRTNGLST